MASAIAAARQQINDVGADGDLDGARAPRRDRPRRRRRRRPDRAARRQARSTRPSCTASRSTRLACALLDMQQPEPVEVPAPDRPARHGQEPDRARDRATGCGPQRGRAIETRRGEPFYGFVEMSGGPSSDEFTFRYEYVPDSRAPRRRAADPGSAFVEAMRARLGGDDRRGQHDPRRRAARRSTARSTAGSALYLPAEGRDRDRRARASRVLIAYNPGLVGATATSPTPGTRASRPPLEVTSNWPALVAARRPRAARAARRWRSTPSASTRDDGAGVDAAVPRHRGARGT